MCGTHEHRRPGLKPLQDTPKDQLLSIILAATLLDIKRLLRSQIRTDDAADRVVGHRASKNRPK